MNLKLPEQKQVKGPGLDLLGQPRRAFRPQRAQIVPQDDEGHIKEVLEDATEDIIEVALSSGQYALKRDNYLDICECCKLQVPKYTCPRCSIRYCGLECYKKHGESCTEAFFQKQVLDTVEQESGCGSIHDGSAQKQKKKLEVLYGDGKLDTTFLQPDEGVQNSKLDLQPQTDVQKLELEQSRAKMTSAERETGLLQSLSSLNVQGDLDDIPAWLHTEAQLTQTTVDAFQPWYTHILDQMYIQDEVLAVMQPFGYTVGSTRYNMPFLPHNTWNTIENETSNTDAIAQDVLPLPLEEPSIPTAAFKKASQYTPMYILEIIVHYCIALYAYEGDTQELVLFLQQNSQALQSKPLVSLHDMQSLVYNLYNNAEYHRNIPNYPKIIQNSIRDTISILSDTYLLNHTLLHLQTCLSAKQTQICTQTNNSSVKDITEKMNSLVKTSLSHLKTTLKEAVSLPLEKIVKNTSISAEQIKFWMHGCDILDQQDKIHKLRYYRAYCHYISTKQIECKPLPYILFRKLGDVFYIEDIVTERDSKVTATLLANTSHLRSIPLAIDTPLMEYHVSNLKNILGSHYTIKLGCIEGHTDLSPSSSWNDIGPFKRGYLYIYHILTNPI